MSDEQGHEVLEGGVDPGPPPAAPEECDVVMKGGITSGVVYPKALWVLSERYRFRNIGGASAGAIAAVICAAAEYGGARSDNRLERLEALAVALGESRFVERLFQPYPSGRRPYRLLLAFVTDHHGLPRRLLMLFIRLLVQAWLLVLGTAAGSWAIWKYGYDGAGAVPALVLVAAGLVLAAVALPLLRLRSTLKLENGFGLCPGKRQPRHDTMALLDWMHAEVQACAGRKVDDPPLTFADLAEKNIQLRLMTTDLSAGRPVRLPLAEPNSIGRDPGSHDYVFRREELVPLLPDKLLEWLDKVSVAPPLAGGYRQLPGMDLPIALGARLSLSFPILLSAVRLHARVADGTYEARLFSDGGISSNFPIHFFDGWLPQRPTFGLDLIGPDPNASSNILMPSGPYAPLPRRWVDVSGLTGFAHQIFDSARNWRDTLQMELPGFRERVCHIRLTEDEGGLNLNMSPTTVRALLDRGEAAGYAILSEFSWSQHTWERFRLLSALLEQNLKDAESGDGWAQYHALLAREQFDGFAYADGLDAVWRASADAQFKALLDLAASWGTDGQVSFGAGDLPLPYPTMRISPDV